jgi:sarcosine oxidase subunit gamma
MSDIAMSALDGARAKGIVAVHEMGLQGMVSLRADLGHAQTARAIADVMGAAMPDPRRIAPGQGGAVAWMSPDELLILCPHAEAEAKAASLAEKLAGMHHLALNLSDARAMFEITGDEGALRDVLSKITPADLSAERLAPGEMRRTRLQQVPGALWFETPTSARIICFRSVAQYVFDLLAMAAKPGGEVGYH